MNAGLLHERVVGEPFSGPVVSDGQLGNATREQRQHPRSLGPSRAAGIYNTRDVVVNYNRDRRTTPSSAGRSRLYYNTTTHGETYLWVIYFEVIVTYG